MLTGTGTVSFLDSRNQGPVSSIGESVTTRLLPCRYPPPTSPPPGERGVVAIAPPPPIDPRLEPSGLVELYGKRIYQVGYRLTGNAADAEDVVQETLVKVMRRADSFRGEGDPMGWIYRIALNEAREILRRKRRRPAVSLESLPIDFDQGNHPQGAHAVPASPDSGVVAEEVNAAIRASIAELPDGYREAVVLHDLEGMSYQEAAALMELGLGAFKTRLHRARLQLRQKLDAHWQSEATNPDAERTAGQHEGGVGSS